MMERTQAAVTIAGSVGKSTTSRMLESILAAADAVTHDAPQILVVLSEGPNEQGQPWRDNLQSLTSRGVAVLSADDASVAESRLDGAITFGLASTAHFRVNAIHATLNGTSFLLHHDGVTYPVALSILGEYQATNAAASIAAAYARGVDIRTAIAALERITLAGRWTMETLPGPSGTVIINDAVSATMHSTSAALKTLALVTPAGRRSVAVLGELTAPETSSREDHDRIGRLVVRLNVKKLVVVGESARHIHNAAGLEGSWDGESVLVGSRDEAYALLRDDLRSGDVVLVKSTARAGLGHLGDRLGSVAS